MTVLKTFPAEDRGKIDEAFFRGAKAIEEGDLDGQPRSIAASVDLETIGILVDEVMSGEREYDDLHLIDVEVAPTVHSNLDFTRKQAAQPELWHWLAVMWRPDFVRYRWPWEATDRTFKSMREKFLGAGTDIYSNAFGRLWWMAELSLDLGAEDPYHVTRKALQVQFLANRLLDPAFARYRPAVVAFAERLADESTETVNHANRRFNQALTSIQLESRTTDELREIVDDVVIGVKEDFEV